MRRIELQRRTADMFTGREDLEPLQTVADFPVYCGVAEGAPEDDLAADMEWMISRGSGMVQLGGLVPAELLYSKSHNASVGGIWRRHHEEFAEFLHEYAAGDIVEIGGGNGVLNAIYCARYRPGCAWTIIDPTDVELADGVSARYVRRMWDGDVDFARDGIGCGTLVHSHLMEHQYDLRGFMGLNAQRLGEGRRMVFSLPDLKEWLRRKYSNALFFEHTYLITEDYADAILGEYGFRILAKERFGDGHSIFYATERAHGGAFPDRETDYGALYEENSRLFQEYAGHIRDFAARADRFAGEAPGGAWLFGAHIFSQQLLRNGLDEGRIRGILDNDALKQGGRLYGTGLTVFPPSVLAGEERPRLILSAGAYTREIRDDVLRNINRETVILE